MWNGNLCNSTRDIVVDSLLLVALIGAFVPQIYRLRNLPTTQGISSHYLLFNAIFSNAQLSYSLFHHAYGWPSVRSPFLSAKSPVLDQIARGRLHGLAAYGAILGLFQISAMWCCSILLMIAYSRGSTNGIPNGNSLPIIVFLHAAVAVFPAIAISLPKPSTPSMGTDAIMALIDMTNTVVAPLFAILQFYAQYRELRSQNGDPGALSLLSLSLQALFAAVIAYRWLVRLGKPDWNPGGEYTGVPFRLWLLDMLNVWYQWGFIAWNFGFHAVGCALLLACYWFAVAYKDHRPDAENTSLLG